MNVSEGRDHVVIDAIAAAGGTPVLDVHRDRDHHRSVITLAGTLSDAGAAARRVVAAAVARIDLRDHDGVHPRLGAADVVPFVPLASDETAWDAAMSARNDAAHWIADELGVPCFLYGPERTLPEVRRRAFRGLEPDTGPRQPHPTAGATAVGVRGPLVAYNLWLDAEPTSRADLLAVARELATEVRGPAVRALGLAVDRTAQVSCNVLDASGRTLETTFEAVSAGATARGCRVARAELVGLTPRATLDAIPRPRWAQLGLSEETTIERRWAERDLD